MLIAIHQAIGDESTKRVGLTNVVLGTICPISRTHCIRIIHFPSIMHTIAIGVIRAGIREIDVYLIKVRKTIEVAVNGRMLKYDINIHHGGGYVN